MNDFVLPSLYFRSLYKSVRFHMYDKYTSEYFE